MSGARLIPGTALGAAAVLLPDVARAEGIERESSGVLVTVDITPLECMRGCGGDLPATGAELPTLLLWLALALVAAGLALIATRRLAAPPGSVRAVRTTSPYYVVSGRRAEVAGVRGRRRPRRTDGVADDV